MRSYLDWTSFAYRMLDSDLASKTLTPDEGVRVDSYIELLKEKGRGIEQHLTSFDVVGISTEGSRTLVATKETWAYRYVSVDGKAYVTPRYTTSYDSTYTVIERPPDGWVVDGVAAKALNAVH